ncbi:penicillin-binding transpeptidase domain-containing protein [Alkalibaculum sp. M08DMB]|uniref:Penicillin-binding transpeptidase domain-containing protein n=1 Tax=Alkalibaculum sporogenes TaxID=2655001 RepID=A0A6A7K946_9FIRM|nr:penicillin-binding transpeptidase domain-containing protein [Alkalibaculum sporogenes]MPW25998.1 penicillin-binding transpeptidase domain-containing protein [Alkalibaculum sporogenes]
MFKKHIIVLIGLLIMLIFTGCVNKSPVKEFEQYAKSWQKQEYVDMYEKLSIEDKEAISLEEFVVSYKEFYNNLGIKSIKVEVLTDEKELKDEIEHNDQVTLPFEVNLETLYGEKSYSMDGIVLREEVDGGKEKWSIDWDYNMIFKDMEEGDTIVTRSVTPARGEILDRNNKKIAENSNVIQVGIVPGRLGEMKDEIISDLSSAFDITTEYINSRLELSWVNDDTFVDLIKIPKGQLNVIEKLNNKNNGATYKEIGDRVYPYKEIAAHLTGYLGYPSEDDMKELEPLGFTANDRIGKTGLERIFDEKLRGIPGMKIAMVSASGKEKEIFSEEPVKDGEDLKLTIDIDMQTKLYNQIKNEEGTATSMDYKTGEVMALVSSPSYDPNKFILGISAENLASLQEAEDKPLLNRFTKVYSPGSTFKPITAAIALNEKKIDQNFSIDTRGLQWQKDASWGSYSITRVTDPGGSVNLDKAMIYSDNIFFGRVALEIGEDTFVEKAKDFGIGVDLNIRYGTDKSQLAASDDISSEVLLADTGYGQGQVLVNILNIPKAYSAFVNKGSVVEPKLIMDSEEPKFTNIIDEDIAEKIFNIMIRVVEDSAGTGREARISGKTIAGKTGTAEVGTIENSTTKEELGWFAAIDKSDEQPYITAVMIENVHGRGGSHVAIPLVRKFIESY